MKELVTQGDICLKDNYNFTYKVAEITYTQWEDESFTYEITPIYSVIELLDTKLFQGIPGIDLDLKKASYKRENIVPVFISERAPGKNREDLWALLKEYNMDYLNQLEWLIRTDMQYSGDRLFVNRPANKSMKIESIRVLGNRSAVICKRLLEVICYGDIISTPTITINNSNRKQYYDLLMALYSTEHKFIDTQRNTGIAAGAKKGNYKGRTRIKIDTLEAQHIYSDYEANKINSMTAAQMLGISKSTFLRRYKEYKNMYQ